ncbi:biotin--[acetyl-CoA-carboxylase] ligase [bacterium]|jgi:BirA family transcriptional regulator, biotin operon repressor / biotin---[acetyl-CoA-carboxylase] ligase|nr:biotin--[acetyl-CoA-carboxylase] ligase [bacterium]
MSYKITQKKTNFVKEYFLRLIQLESIDSTNDYAKRIVKSNLKQNPSDCVIISSRQYKGRGQFGRIWHSQSNGGLYYTYLHFPNKDWIIPSTITMDIGNICIKCLKNIILGKHDINPEILIEWPNDIILNKKKIGGVLIETNTKNSVSKLPYLIIGIGINVSQKIFPDELKPIATSIYRELKMTISKKEVQEAITDSIREYLKK